MQRVDELGSVSYTHKYVSMKRLTWMTMAITAVIGLLYFVVGFPPAFDTFSEKLTVSYLAIIFAAVSIRAAAVHRYARSVPPTQTLPVIRTEWPGPRSDERTRTRDGRQRPRRVLIRKQSTEVPEPVPALPRSAGFDRRSSISRRRASARCSRTSRPRLGRSRRVRRHAHPRCGS